MSASSKCGLHVNNAAMPTQSRLAGHRRILHVRGSVRHLLLFTTMSNRTVSAHATFHSLLFDAFRKQMEVVEVAPVKQSLVRVGPVDRSRCSRILDFASGAPCEAEVPGPWVRRPTAGHSIAANNIAAYDVPRRCPTCWHFSGNVGRMPPAPGPARAGRWYQ